MAATPLPRLTIALGLLPVVLSPDVAAQEVTPAQAPAAADAVDAAVEDDIDYPGLDFSAGRARGNIELEGALEGAVVTGEATHGGGRASLTGSFWFGWHARPLGELALFHGPLDRRRGLILDMETELFAATEVATADGAEMSWSLAEAAALILGPVTFAQRLAYQRPSHILDRVWSPQRGVLAMGGTFAMPALVRGKRFDAFDFSFTVDVLHRDGAYYGMSAEARVAWFAFLWGPRLGGPQLSLMSLEAQLDERELPFEGESGREGSGYFRALVDVVSLSGARLTPSLRLGARLGVAVLDTMELTYEEAMPPAGEDEGDAVMSVLWALALTYSASEVPFVPDWSWAQRTHPVSGDGFGVALTSFERIDPTGLALDVGGQLVAQARFDLGERWSLGAEGALVLASRRQGAFGEPLPRHVPQVGELFVLGRLAADLALRLHSVVWVRASAFAEYSDRDDLSLLERWSPDLRWRFGGTLGLSVVL